MSPHARHLGRTLAIALAVATAALLTAAMNASAYYTASGSASARTSVATLPAPAITSASPGGGSVTLSWSSITAPGSGTVSYYVTRDDGAAGSGCPASGAPTSATSCTDTGVATGAHQYTVTAVWRTWRATSASAGATVASGPVTQLAFTTQPGGSSTGGVAFPQQPVVTARDANGLTVVDYSGSVTLSIVSGTGTSGAALTGCTGTLRNGATSFAGCRIDKAGSSYRLRATDRARSVDSSSFTVSVGAAAQLAFTTQPGNGTGGGDLSTTPVVTALDAGGNVATGYSGTVQLSIAPDTGTPGAELSGCGVDRLRSGVTTFDDCQVDRAGSGYRLHASDNRGLATADSATFNVTVGSLADIAFSTQPSGATGGSDFTTQPVVTAVDAGGNTVTSYNSTVTLSIRSGTGTSGAALSSTCRGTRLSGVVTFAGCNIDRVGTGYRLHATDSGFRSDDSASFDVTVGALARLAFTASPSGATAGSAFSTAPVVVGADAGGNAVAGYAGTVTLSVQRDPSALSGCVAGVRSGATTFTGCKISRSGSGWVLHADDGTLSGDSSSFTVSPGNATQLQFTTQPAGAIARAAFGTQPVVSALDAFGNVATGYSGTVTLAIKSSTGTSGASLSSCSSVRASSGVATFSGCSIDRLGSAYQLRGSDNRGLPSVDSAAFNVTVGSAASLAISAATTSPTAGVADSLTITAHDLGGNVATGYTGVHNLTFGGAGSSPSGTLPTVADNAGNAVAFGTATPIAFVNGVATVSAGANGAMVLRDAGSDSVTVRDGTIAQEDTLDVTVRAGATARLAWVNVSAGGSLSSPCLFTCTKSNASNGGSFAADVAVTDLDGNTVSGLGSGHSVTISTPGSGAGSGGSFSSSSTVLSVTRSISSSNSAETTSNFTFRFQSSGSWTTHTFTATPTGADRYTAATATINK